MTVINKTKTFYIVILSLILPVISFNLWVYLFHDFLLANLFYLFIIFMIPVIFFNCFDIEMSSYVKNWQDFIPFEENNTNEKDSEYVLFCVGAFILFIIHAICLRFHDFKIKIYSQFPLFDHVFYEILYAIITSAITLVIMPCLEVKYYFEIGYNTFDNTFIGKLFISFIFTAKYLLFTIYLLKGNTVFMILGFIKLIVIFFIVGYIYSGKNKDKAKKCLLVIYSIAILVIIMLHYKHKLKFLSPEVEWNNPQNIFNRLRDWRNSRNSIV